MLHTLYIVALYIEDLYPFVWLTGNKEIVKYGLDSQLKFPKFVSKGYWFWLNKNDDFKTMLCERSTNLQVKRK